MLGHAGILKNLVMGRVGQVGKGGRLNSVGLLEHRLHQGLNLMCITMMEIRLQTAEMLETVLDAMLQSIH